MKFFAAILLVAFGGSLGAASRYLINVFFVKYLSLGFMSAKLHSISILCVNLLGCFLLGLIYVGLNKWRIGLPDADFMRVFLISGFLGAFTTFSSFTLDFMELLGATNDESLGGISYWGFPLVRALGYLFASVCGGIIALALGIHLAYKYL